MGKMKVTIVESALSCLHSLLDACTVHRGPSGTWRNLCSSNDCSILYSLNFLRSIPSFGADDMSSKKMNRNHADQTY